MIAEPPSIRRSPRVVNEQRWTEQMSFFADANYRHNEAFCREVGGRQRCSIDLLELGESSLACVRVRELPVVGGGLAYVAGGPLFDDLRIEEDARIAALDEALLGLIERYVIDRGMILRVQPALRKPEITESIVDLLHRRGFVESAWPAPYHTIVVDLGRDEEVIRASLHQKWRNCLNQAERRGLSVRWSDEAQAFELFESMLEPLEERKGFKAALDPMELSRVNERGRPGPAPFQVGLAMDDGSPVAGIVTFAAGDTCVYLLGASTDRGRSHNASYLLQWDTMMRARRDGRHWYDLGGVDAEANPGVHRFKTRMGGETWSAAPPVQMLPRGLRRFIAEAGEIVARRIQALR